MGAPMAKNLHKAGLLAAVWNRSQDKATALGAELSVMSTIGQGTVSRSSHLVVPVAPVPASHSRSAHQPLRCSTDRRRAFVSRI